MSGLHPVHPVNPVRDTLSPVRDHDLVVGTAARHGHPQAEALHVVSERDHPSPFSTLYCSFRIRIYTGGGLVGKGKVRVLVPSRKMLL